MSKKYLITGGFGLIGSQLANTINGDITILSRTQKNKERLHIKNVRVIIKDLNKISQNDVENIDIIYHCASTVDNYHVLTNPHIDSHTNIDGTIALLEACKNLPKKPKIIYLSTFFVYGNEYEHSQKPINEESKTDPLALYPATKLCAENIIKLYSRLYSIPYIICRLTNVYGEYEHFDNRKKGALNYLIMQCVKGEQVNLYKGGNFFRDYIHVDDVVSALMFLEQKVTNDLFLVGFGTAVKFKNIIEYIHKNTGNKSKILEIEPPLFHKVVGITNFVADTSKTRSLGWKARIDYKKGLQRVIAMYKKLQVNQSL